MDPHLHPLVCPKVWGQYTMKHDQLVSVCAVIARDRALPSTHPPSVLRGP